MNMKRAFLKSIHVDTHHIFDNGFTNIMQYANWCNFVTIVRLIKSKYSFSYLIKLNLHLYLYFSDSNFFVLADNAFPLSASLSSNTEVAGLAGQSVLLPCHLSPACGSIHSIKWYRADRRVYIFSEIAEISRAEDDLSDR